MRELAIKIKVNVLTLIKLVRKFLKWRRQNIINNHREDVPERPI